jgi:MoaA/NifB/PqqE/SkfB family radical SAM enzyme
MCSIWKRDVPDLPLEKIEELFSGKILKKLLNVSFTGGEPLLRNDIIDIIKIIISSCKRLSIISIDSNGSMPSILLNTVKELKHIMPRDLFFAVGISLDGPEGIHDKIRGKNGSYQKALKSLLLLKEFQVTNHDFSVVARCTVSRLNVHYLKELDDTMRRLGLTINYGPVSITDSYINSMSLEQDFVMDRDDIDLMSEFLSREARRKKIYGKIIESIRCSQRRMACLGRFQAVMVEPTGNVYPCGQSSQLLFGNIYNDSLDSIWISEQAYEGRTKMDAICSKCLSLCYPERISQFDITRAYIKRFMPGNVLDFYRQLRKR